MLQLKIVSGKKAGDEIIARRFPFRIGRGSANDLALDGNGVFEKHLDIDLRGKEFVLKTQPNTFVAVAGQQKISDAVLRNGDLIEIGENKLLFNLSPNKQRGLNGRELAIWIGLVVVSLFQIALIIWLRRP